MLLVVVILVVVVARALVCDGAVIDTFVEVFVVDVAVGVMFIVSDVAVDLLMNALTESIRGVLTDIDVGVLVDVNVNDFVIPGPLDEFCCSAAFERRPMGALDCDSVLQAWMPSYQL